MCTFKELMQENGYECQTTFWDDFSIADKFGKAAIKDTFKRAFEEWKSNTVYVTELVMVLNHKTWQHYNSGKTEFATLYNALWEQADGWCCDNLKDDDARYFFRVTD